MSKIIDDRLQVIKKLCTGKDVLDVGCADHNAAHEARDVWLHKIIKSVAKSVIGVDLEQEEVNRLTTKGYTVIAGNAETVNLGHQFDVVVAGELIEHLANPGLFLGNMAKHLHPGGLLIITTPNAFAIRFALAHLFHGRGSSNLQHTCYFDYYTLRELCSRYPFELVAGDYYFDEAKNRVKRWLSRLVTFIRKSYAPGLFFVLKKI